MGKPTVKKKRGQRGFVMLDVLLALLIVTLLGVAVTLDIIQTARTKAATATGQMAWRIAQAARWSNTKNGSWPADIKQLISEGYFPSSWTGKSPFGTSFTLSSDNNGCTIRVGLPSAQLAEAAKFYAPASAVSGTDLLITVPPSQPRMEALNNILARDGNDEDRTMNADLIMGGNKITGLADPIANTDAMTLHAATNRYIPKTGGTMTGALDNTNQVLAPTLYDGDDMTHWISPAGVGNLAAVTVYTTAGGALVIEDLGNKTLLDIVTK